METCRMLKPTWRIIHSWPFWAKYSDQFPPVGHLKNGGFIRKSLSTCSLNSGLGIIVTICPDNSMAYSFSHNHGSVENGGV